MSTQFNVYYPSGDIEMPENPVVDFPYQSDNWQKHSFNVIEKMDDKTQLKDDLLCCVPTASGKTDVAKYGCVYCVKKMGKRAVYTTPIKSLSNEKFHEFTELFGPYGITVGIMTGDNKINPDADIILLTAEILRNALYRKQKKIDNPRHNLPENFIESIGCVVIDEIHYMNNEERGKVWEETIVMLPQSIQVIMLSGTIGNRDYFAKWISNCRQKNVAVIHKEKRVVPLRHFIYTPDQKNPKLHEYMNANDQYSSVDFNNARRMFEDIKKDREKKHKQYDESADIKSVIRYLKDNEMLQAIIFSFSKRDCEKYADMLDGMNFLDLDEEGIESQYKEHSEKKQIDFLFHKYIGSQKNESGEYKFQNIAEVAKVKALLERGIAYHHGGMLQNLRELIEILMKKKLIKVLFATETLCIGVNVPAKTCVFTGIKKPCGKEKKRNLTSAEYRQMAGRAGRRGLDDSGNIIFLPLREFPFETDFQSVVNGSIPDIKSNFRFDYQSILKISQELEIDPIELFNKSLMNAEVMDMINNLEKDKQKIEAQTSEILSIISEKKDNVDNDIVQSILELIEKEEKINDNKNKFILLDKKQEKEIKELRNKIFGNQDTREMYQLEKKRKESQKSLEYVESSITSYKTYVNTMYNRFRSVLEDLEYSVKSPDEKFITKQNVMTKGIICSQINECNVLLLTEMIMQNFFNDITIEEIVMFVSLFTEPVLRDSPCSLDQVEGTDEVKRRIRKIREIATNLESIEQEYLQPDHFSDFTLCYDYIDIVYDWASGETICHIVANYLIPYEVPIEAFCKNMTKISNILQTMLGIYKMLGTNIEMIPKLEQAIKMVLRDIVQSTSLYL
jgi:superfamily II RNA helicase